MNPFKEKTYLAENSNLSTNYRTESVYCKTHTFQNLTEDST